MHARFDWYQATVPDVDPADICAALESVTNSPATVAWEAIARPPQGYAFGRRCQDEEGPTARVMWGGTHAHPHVIASGEASPGVAQLLRAQFPRHRVTRADVCMDYADPGAYDRLQDLGLAVAQQHGIRVGTAGDHLLTKVGRTVYLGAPTSVVRVRIYDKAAELRQQLRWSPRILEVPEHLARFEVQVRPRTPEAKVKAGQLEPEGFYGSAGWLRDLVQRVEGEDVAAVSLGWKWRQPDVERAYRYVLSNHGAVFDRLLEGAGSRECAGLQLYHDLDEIRRIQRCKQGN